MSLGKWDRRYCHTAEARLFKAIVIQLFRDAQNICIRMEKPNAHKAQAERETLIHDMTTQWFETICQFAGHNAGKTRKKAMQILNGKSILTLRDDS